MKFLHGLVILSSQRLSYSKDDKNNKREIYFEIENNQIKI